MSNRHRNFSSVLAAAAASVAVWAVAQQTPPASAPSATPVGAAPLIAPDPNASTQIHVGPNQPAPAQPSADGPTANPPSAGPQATPPTDQPAKRSNEELDTLLAPVALYPDTVLSQALIASTYPLEVVQARRWVGENPTLQGPALADALNQQPWDPSVKALVNVPSVLQLLDDKLDWTIKLGDAFLAQQKDVMDRVQHLRAAAQSAGFLKSDDKQKISVAPAAPVEQTPPPAAAPPAPSRAPPQVAAGGPYASPDGGAVDTGPVVEAPPQQPIVIEPAQPDVIYVPVYDPGVVYGTWAYPAYRPFFWRPYGYATTDVFYYDRPYRCGPAWSYAWARPDWRVRQLDLDVGRYAAFNPRYDRDAQLQRVRERDRDLHNGQYAWQHDRDHRLGVQYRDAAVARRYDSPRSDAQHADAQRNTGRGTDATVNRTTADRTRDARPLDDRSKTNGVNQADAARIAAARGAGQSDVNRSDAARADAGKSDTARRAVIPGAVIPGAVIPGAVVPDRSADKSANAGRADANRSNPGRSDAAQSGATAGRSDAVPAKPSTNSPAAAPRADRDDPKPTPAPRQADNADRGKTQTPAAPAPAPAPAKKAAPPDNHPIAAPKPTPAPAPAPVRVVPAPAPPAPAPSRGSAPDRPAPAPAAPAKGDSGGGNAKSSDSGAARSK